MLSGILVVIGVAVLVQTARVGGGIGYAIGGLLVVAGVGRLYVLHR